MKRPALAFPLLLLAACGSEPAPTPSPAPAPTVVGPRTLVAAGLSEQLLGPRIVGPEGEESSSGVSFEGQPVAQMISYVACPAAEEGAEAAGECIPAEMPEDAIYTYVHRVVSTGADGETQPFAFRTGRPAAGFANVIGFDRAQAEAALGPDYAIGVQVDNGRLVWRIERGDGWNEGEELTFFWQSTAPPEGSAEAFEIDTPTGTAPLTGPFPRAEVRDEAGDEPAPD